MNKQTCCEKCWNNEFSLKNTEGICGLSCECHLPFPEVKQNKTCRYCLLEEGHVGLHNRYGSEPSNQQNPTPTSVRTFVGKTDKNGRIILGDMEETTEGWRERFYNLKSLSGGDVSFHCYECEEEVKEFIAQELSKAREEERAATLDKVEQIIDSAIVIVKPSPERKIRWLQKRIKELRS